MTFNEHREAHVNYIYQLLANKEENYLAASPMKKIWTIRWVYKTKPPAADALILLGYPNNAYNRFVLNVLLYGQYISMKDALDELKRANDETALAWVNKMLQSPLVITRQNAAATLPVWELKYLDCFQWWEQDLHFSRLSRSIQQ